MRKRPVTRAFVLLSAGILRMRFRCSRKCKAGIARQRRRLLHPGGLLYPDKDYAQARKAFGKMFDVPPDSAAAICLPRGCCCVRNTIPWPKSTRRKRRRSIPSCRSRISFLVSLSLQIASPEAIAEFQKELAINPGACRDLLQAGRCLFADPEVRRGRAVLQRSIWLDPTSTGPYILMGKVLREKRRVRVGGARAASGRRRWIPTIRRPTTCSARLTATWGRKKKRESEAES